MTSQLDKARAFCALHERPGAFIIPNPWDAGTAKLLAAMGFEALATTSLGVANMLGSSGVSLEVILANARTIVEATDLPVSVDLENCGAHEPRRAAEAIRRAADTGAVGGSIEDFSGDRDRPIYDFSHAVERVQAAVEVARALPTPFTLTARAEKLPARPQGHRRYDPPPAGLRGRRRRRPLRAGPVRSRHDQDGGVLAGQALQPRDGLCRPDANRRAIVRRWRQAHQRRRSHVALRARSVPELRARDEGQGVLHLHPRDGAGRRAARRLRRGHSSLKPYSGTLPLAP